jgi:hypothetical protein
MRVSMLAITLERNKKNLIKKELTYADQNHLLFTVLSSLLECVN